MLFNTILPAKPLWADFSQDIICDSFIKYASIYCTTFFSQLTAQPELC